MSIPCGINPMGAGGLPAGYVRVNYLESVKGAQYLTVPVSLTQKSFMEVDMAFLGSTSSGNIAVAGARPKYGSSNITIWYNPAGTSSAGVLGNYDKGFSYRVSPVGSRHVHSISSTNYSVDGRVIHTINNTATFSIARIALFSFLNDGVQDPRGQNTRIYSLRAGTVQDAVHLVPCLDPKKRPCMFDLVTKTPYYNAGKSEFLWG